MKSKTKSIGDGRSNIVKADSLKSPDEWEEIARAILTENGAELKNMTLFSPIRLLGAK